MVVGGGEVEEGLLMKYCRDTTEKYRQKYQMRLSTDRGYSARYRLGINTLNQS